jgi:hypothetical protein
VRPAEKNDAPTAVLAAFSSSAPPVSAGTFRRQAAPALFFHVALSSIAKVNTECARFASSLSIDRTEAVEVVEAHAQDYKIRPHAPDLE